MVGLCQLVFLNFESLDSDSNDTSNHYNTFKLIIFSVYEMTTTNQYESKCDECDMPNPEKTIPVVYDNQNGGIRTKYLCVNCFKNMMHG